MSPRAFREHLARPTLTLLALLSLAACGGDGVTPSPIVKQPPPDEAVATVELTAPMPSVQNGQQIQFTATAKNAAGANLAGRDWTWRSSDSLVASVSSTGLVSARREGAVLIAAATGGKEGTFALSVLPVPIASLSISPNAFNLTVGDSITLAVVARDAGGNVLTGRPITLRVSDSTVATLRGSDLKGIKPGDVVVTALSGELSAQAQAKVIPRPVSAVTFDYGFVSVLAGQSVTIRGVAVDARGQPVAGAKLRWTSSNLDVATADSSGVVRGVATGPAEITASVDGVSKALRVAVWPAPTATAGVVEIRASIPASVPASQTNQRLLFLVDGPQSSIVTHAGFGCFSGLNIRGAVVQVAVPTGTVTARVLARDSRPSGGTYVGSSGRVMGITVGAGQKTEIAVPMIETRSSLSGPTSVAGGDAAAFSWTINAPGFARAGRLPSALEWQRNLQPAARADGSTAATSTADAEGVLTGSASFRTSQTPDSLYVRAVVDQSMFYRDPSSPQSGGGCSQVWAAAAGLNPAHRLDVK